MPITSLERSEILSTNLAILNDQNSTDSQKLAAVIELCKVWFS